MNKFSRAARSVTFAAIVGLSMGITAPAALAQNEMLLAQEAQKANIDFSKTGSLTIHKKDITGVDNTGSKPATGDEVADVRGKGLAGVEFTLKKVNLDLSKPENWAKLPKDAAEAKNLGFVDSEITMTPTDDAGNTTKTNLPLGLYVVSETKVPEGVVAGPDFLVTLPMTNADGKAWDYDVVVYPKNTKAEATKEVVDANMNQGDQIVYKVNTPIPALGDGEKVSGYKITDDYDEAKVEVKSSDDVKVSVGDTVIGPGGYELKLNEGGKLVVTFNETGHAELTKNPGKIVTTEIKATVKADVEGEVKNTADVIFNNPSDESRTVKVPTNEVFTYYGSVKIVKKDKDEQEKVLEGAEFQLYRSDDATCDISDIKPENLVKGTSSLANTLPVDGTFTTDANGQISITGLHVTNLDDSTKTVSKKYCLLETKAPAGYVTPNKEDAITPFEITVQQTKDPETQKVVSGTVKNASVSIENKKNNTPNLPMTGGAGIGILAAIGAAIIGIGAWFARRNSSEA